MAGYEPVAGPESSANKLPSAPSHCSCGKPSVVNQLSVFTSSGRVLAGSASEFCERDNHANPKWELQDRYKYSHWTTYCASCYSGLKKPEPSPFTENQVSVAWRWFLAEICKESENLAGVMTPINLTDEQKDRAIEIVNREAKRTNQPDATPEEYKLKEVWA